MLQKDYMKLFNIFRTLPPRKQQSFFLWLRVSALLAAIIFTVIFLISSKLLFDIAMARQRCTLLQAQAGQFDEIAASKKEYSGKLKMASEQQEQLRQFIEHPTSPSKYFIEIYKSLSQEITLEVISFSLSEGVIVEVLVADLAVLDELVKKLINFSFFNDVSISMIRAISTEKEKTHSLKCIIKCQLHA